jgi:hypothetical protein
VKKEKKENKENKENKEKSIELKSHLKCHPILKVIGRPNVNRRYKPFFSAFKTPAIVIWHYVIPYC